MSWYLRYGLSSRDVEELLAERSVVVDHVTVYRWVQRFTSEFIDAARPSRHASGDRWFVDETYVKVAGHWTYLYRAIDQHGQVIDVLISERRDGTAARAFFTRARTRAPAPLEVTTDRAPVYPRMIDDLVPAARQVVEQYANNAVEADHDRLKARLRPMRGLKRIRSARTIAAGHAFVQNLRRGHYGLATESAPHDRLQAVFDDLAHSLEIQPSTGETQPSPRLVRSTQQRRLNLRPLSRAYRVAAEASIFSENRYGLANFSLTPLTYPIEHWCRLVSQAPCFVPSSGGRYWD